jgi:gas vesicle protein GvpL/GvpF
MPPAGAYLYGFTDRTYRPADELRGLGGAPVRLLPFRDVAAVVSPHPVQRLMPSRSNLEPHHRIVRRICSEAPLVPAAFGHISDTDEQMLGVLSGNYEDIRSEIDRLAHKCEMTLGLSWAVDNIFDFLVRVDRDLRELRDRVFRDREPSLNEKLQVGSLFEATLNRYRERLSAALLGAFNGIAHDVVSKPPRNEKSICISALLVDRSAVARFEQKVQAAARLFDGNYTLDYNGPWPPYSFVRLRLQAARPSTAA